MLLVLLEIGTSDKATTLESDEPRRCPGREGGIDIHANLAGSNFRQGFHPVATAGVSGPGG